MKEIDRDGLLLCRLQGNIFASSLEYCESSSEIFMRRFMMSKLVKEFDLKAVLNDSLTISEAFQIIENEFGKTSYGKVKYNREVLFWIGYIYRYMSYTYDLSSKSVYKIIKPKELNERYYVYHTFDCSQAIERILEEKNISFDTDKQNERLLKMMRRIKYEKEVEITNMNSDYAHKLFKDFKNDRSLFENEDDFKEYVYSKEKIDSYVETKAKEGYKLLAVLYKEDVVGEIRLKEQNLNVYELGIVLKDDHYKNKGLGTVALKKGLDYAKHVLGIQSIIVEILKTNERSIHVFKKLGFIYKNENDKFVYYSKLL